MPNNDIESLKENTFDFCFRMIGHHENSLKFTSELFEEIDFEEERNIIDYYKLIVSNSKSLWTDSTKNLRNPGLIAISSDFSEENLRKLETVVGSLTPIRRAILLIASKVTSKLNNLAIIFDIPAEVVQANMLAIERIISKEIPELSSNYKEAVQNLPTHEYIEPKSMPATAINQELQGLSGRVKVSSWRRKIIFLIIIIIVIILAKLFIF